VQIVKAVAVLLAPFTPEKSEQLWSQLEAEGSVHDATLADALAAPPAEFGAPEELFEKVEDEAVEALNEQLRERVESGDDAENDAGGEKTTEDATDGDADAEDADVAPLATERVSFEAFQDLDLRVGEILVAEPVEGADELLRLEVDLGAETRQIVAGLRELHDADALPGTRVVVVANLEPTELMGVESDGMLLAAGEDADLLTTHGDSPPGTQVR
jgi:methionyl-tRNA synthetase